MQHGPPKQDDVSANKRDGECRMKFLYANPSFPGESILKSRGADSQVTVRRSRFQNCFSRKRSLVQKSLPHTFAPSLSQVSPSFEGRTVQHGITCKSLKL